MVTMKSLRLPFDRVSVFAIDEASEVLQEYDVTGEGEFVYVVPDSLATTVVIRSAITHSVINGGTIYVL
jgi:hypothetical protein